MRIKSGDGSQLRQNHQDLCKRVKLGIRVVYRSPKETFRHLPHFCREAPFSAFKKAIFVWRGLFQTCQAELSYCF